MRAKKMNKLEKLLLEELKYPEKWEFDVHVIRHKNGLTLWTSNGLPFLDTHPTPYGFSLLSKLRINKALKDLREKKFVELLKDKESE